MKYWFSLFLFATACYAQADEKLNSDILFASSQDNLNKAQIIRKIIIQGNKYVPTEAIRAKIPYREGSAFNLQKSSDLIRSLYAMGYFKPNIKVSVEEFSPTSIDVYISLEEKRIIDEIIFEGNKNLKRDEIDKKALLAELRGIDQNDLSRIAQQVKELYVSKDYHRAEVGYELVPVSDDRAQAKFIINEGDRSAVKQVIFCGNKSIPSKKLRSLIFTREDWLFGFLTKSGSYQPEAIEYDKYVVEHYYKSNGFLHAHVDTVDVQTDPQNPCHFIVTFYITEGDQYLINNISAQGNDLLTEEQILSRINIRPGELYSSEKIRQTLELLRLVWGEYGYIFAEINPGIEPDEACKTVNLSFTTNLGCPVDCNRITITGNLRTQENVIRRQLTVNEGSMLTTRDMDDSKERVERLGYFDQRNGVNWKITRLNESCADLDLVLKEVKTGRLFMDLKLGGDAADFQSPSQSLQVGIGARDINFRGTGLRYSASAYFSRQDRNIALNVVNPWLFNQPYEIGFDIYHRSSTYQEFKHVNSPPKEHDTGLGGTFGFATNALGGVLCNFGLGFDSITYKNRILANPPDKNFQSLIDRLFQPGNVLWANAVIVQDYRNNQLTPSRGYLWTSSFKIGIPHENNGFGYIKWDADAHWYTPLINEFDLIFHLHGHLGLINEISNFNMPYRELYHIGGPATVRGFLYGQIGPSFRNDSIGAKKAMWMNAELIFPVTKDFGIVGLVFYDGGAGWDTPSRDIAQLPPDEIKNNQFHFRQTVGLGIKIKNPTPISIAIGLKLDRNKRSGESASEIHFSSSVDF